MGSESSSGNRRVYGTLDGLRGVAAVLVVLYHDRLLLGSWRPQNAYLAVDLFFALSGCVLENAYGSRLAARPATARFALIRVIRLWPLYALGISVGVTYGLLHGDGSIAFLAAGMMPVAIVCGLLLLPTPGMMLTPLNPPGWSLLFEFFVNLFYAAIRRWLSVPVNLLLLAIAAPVFVTRAIHHHTVDIGPYWLDIPGGSFRVAFSFFLGVLLARIPRPARRATPLSPLLVFLVLVAIGWAGPSVPANLARVMLLFPTLIWLGLWLDPPNALRRAFDFAGRTSYPLYAVHLPLCWFLAPQISDVVKGDALRKMAALVLVTILVLISYLLDRIYDRPVRAWLARKLTPPGKDAQVAKGDCEVAATAP